MNVLGQEIAKKLRRHGIETPLKGPAPVNAGTHVQITRSMREILIALRLDPYDDSLAETPHRVAKMFMKEVFYGLDYNNFPKCTTVLNKMRYDEMIAVTCDVKSMCEHHFVPFFGTATVGYIPDTKILGLSKFNRVVDFFSRRPQIQERLTAQVHLALQHILKTEDIAVVIKAKHLCVALRGVQDEKSETVTSQMGGRFMKKAALRSEFLALTR